jgi:hypothetical protein
MRRFEPEKSGEPLLTDGIPALIARDFCNGLAQSREAVACQLL